MNKNYSAKKAQELFEILTSSQGKAGMGDIFSTMIELQALLTQVWTDGYRACELTIERMKQLN